MDSNSSDGFEVIANNRAARQYATRGSHLIFFHIYFAHYIKYAIAEFHKDIFRITEDALNRLAMIVAFRGSGKSTIVTFSYALWAILGVQQKKFVLIICQTQAQAKQHMTNIKYELEDNQLLKSDMGPFREETGGEQWAISSLVFQNTGARIMIASLEQSVRGLRHHQHRPDLIILDDIEDVNSTKTMESRNRTFEWFTREIVPLGDIGTRTIIVGNLLHEDSLVMRLKRKIDEKEMSGVYRWFPLLDAEGICAWPGKFDIQQKIDELRQSVANELAWRQEYLLEIVSDHTRVVHPEWIQYYDEIPKREHKDAAIVGVDLAISQKATADCTAMVTLVTQSYGSKLRAYVLPNPVNDRLTFPDVVQTAAALKANIKAHNCESPEFYVESNGFQEIYVQAFGQAGCRVEGVKQFSDKRSRIALTTDLIKNGIVKFPKTGCEDLILQLTGFGRENHDDLADAFATAMMAVMEKINGSRSFEAWKELCEANGGSMWFSWDQLRHL